MSKIVTMGEILVEIMATEIGQSFRKPGRLIGPYPSGAPAIFIDQVAKLGHACAIVGCVGKDDFGHLNIERLRADGVDTDAIAILDDAVTGSAFVTYRSNGERDFIFNIVNSASAHLDASRVDEFALKDCSHFHVMGSSLFSPGIVEAMKKVVSIVKAQGGTISFDPNVRKEMLGIPGFRDALRYALERCDVFLPSDQEMTLLIDASASTDGDIETIAAKEILGLGVKEIVVKQGARGCTFYAAGQRLHVPALPVDEVDPTGAGDCFGATYITCRKLGKSAEVALRYAAASGAHAVTRKGPMEGTAGFDTLTALLNSR